MNRLRRYWTLWHTLEEGERRRRAERFVERILRRRPAIRRLGLAPDPPGPRRLERVLTVPPAELFCALRARDARRGPLFDDLDGRARAVATTHPEHVGAVFAATERILAGRFDLLGSGDHVLTRSQGGLDWHLDWRSVQRWPADAYYTDLAIVRGDGSDVKLPWELSRCQHLLALGQAYLLAPHTMDPEAAARLRARCALEARHQIDDWIDSNPRGVGINWTCAMEVAMRAFTWLATLALFRGAPELDDKFFGRIVAALWMHGRHVRRNLEISAEGLTSNHYLADVVGLHALAVGLPELEEAAEWGAFAREALECEIGRQVHPDGVDFERSLPYHRLVTEFFLHSALLLRAGKAGPSGPFVERLARMLEFSAAATRPDQATVA